MLRGLLMLLSSLMVEISESIPHSLVEQLKLDNITLTDSAKSIIMELRF